VEKDVIATMNENPGSEEKYNAESKVTKVSDNDMARRTNDCKNAEHLQLGTGVKGKQCEGKNETTTTNPDSTRLQQTVREKQQGKGRRSEDHRVTTSSWEDVDEDDTSYFDGGGENPVMATDVLHVSPAISNRPTSTNNDPDERRIWMEFCKDSEPRTEIAMPGENKLATDGEVSFGNRPEQDILERLCQPEVEPNLGVISRSLQQLGRF
jgi:hypothetical protein